MIGGDLLSWAQYSPLIGPQVAVVRWQPPRVGSFSGFKLKVIPLSEPGKAIKNIQTRDQKSTLKVFILSPLHIIPNILT